MSAKAILKLVLLAFVAASVAVLVFRESQSKASGGPGNPHEATAPVSASPPTATAEAARPPATSTPKVIAYYFHGNYRCPTCRKIEAYAKEAIETTFASALKDGRLEWRTTNVEEPANEHFAYDFHLTTSSLVLVETANGATTRWTNLKEVWRLVGDKATFQRYVTDETRNYLGAP